MKKIVFIVAAMALCWMSLIRAFADDAADLQKLQPLSSSEQSMYEKVKDSASDLHHFIVSRTYIRTVWQIVKDNSMDKNKLSTSDYAKFPPMPNEFVFRYTVDFSEHIFFYNLMLYQGIKREE